MKVLAITAACVAALAIGVGVPSAAAPAVTINYRLSSCLQMPLAGEGQVRFFVRLVNRSARAASFAKTLTFVWLRPDGWKDSWLNSISANSLRVPANRGKRYYVDFGADPTKLILRCAIKVGSSPRLHHVRVLR